MGDRRELREAETAFGTFWAAYPRKVGKLTASIAFHKALKKTTLPVMLAALAWQGQTRQWQQGIFRMRPRGCIRNDGTMKVRRVCRSLHRLPLSWS